MLHVLKFRKLQFGPDPAETLWVFGGFIDNQWVVFDYDAKRNALTYNFDEFCPPGEHILKIVVSDGIGNSSEKEIFFKN